MMFFRVKGLRYKTIIISNTNELCKQLSEWIGKPTEGLLRKSEIYTSHEEIEDVINEYYGLAAFCYLPLWQVWLRY